MTRLLGVLLALCCIAAACGSSDTTATAPALSADRDTTQEPAPEPADTTTTAPELTTDSDTTDDPDPDTTQLPDPELAADPDTTNDPDPDGTDTTGTAPEPADTTTTAPEPTTDSDTTDDPDPDTTQLPDSELAADPEPTPSTTTTLPEPTPSTTTTVPEATPTTVPEPTPSTTTTLPEPTPSTTTTVPEATTTTTTTLPEPTPTTTTTLPAPAPDRLPADPDAPVGDWVAGVNAAGWDFHRHLRDNAVSSPISIGVAFSMSRAGASPDSGMALDQIFGFPEAGSHDAANAVDLRLARASVEPTTLEVANRLFPDEGFSLLPQFVHTAAAQYGADLEPVDTADGARAAEIINRWASEKTRGLIPTVVDPGAVQGQRLILVNTVYLKADWLAPFPSELTSDGQFTTGDNRSVTVPFMRDQKALPRRYVRLGDADAVELPYQGGELAMWLVVPHDPAGLAAVEESLDAAALTGLPNAATTGQVEVTMPKWEQTLPPADLFGWLCPQGFCAGAGFDAIAPGIFISAALHSAKVIVDEKGTEAAAATSINFTTSVPPPPDLTIVADRPFLWAIIHQDTGALLFVGRLVNPAA